MDRYPDTLTADLFESLSKADSAEELPAVRAAVARLVPGDTEAVPGREDVFVSVASLLLHRR